MALCASLTHGVCIIRSASWKLHCVICTISVAQGTFHHCIAPPLQSYISRMHHSHGHRAYASRILLFNLINSLSKNILEQRLTLISFLSRFTTRLRPWFSQNWGPLFFTKILLYVSTRIIHGLSQPTLMVIVISCFIHRLLLQRMKSWSL